MRLFALLVIILALAGCAAGVETPVEEAKEEYAGVEEVALEEPPAPPETTAPSAATADSEAVPSEQVDAPPEKEGVLREQDPVQTSQVRSETTIPSVATDSEAARSAEVNAPPEKEEPTEEQDQTQTEQGISITQEVDPNPVTVGQQLTLTISVKNHAVPQRLGFKDFLPPGMTHVSVTPSQGTCGSGHHGGNEVPCTLGLVPSGGSATVEILATPTVPGTVTNTAVGQAEFTPATPANRNVATITVTPAS
jgi:uncharacterized repeat protein (TIGR01451 family)